MEHDHPVFAGQEEKRAEVPAEVQWVRAIREELDGYMVVLRAIRSRSPEDVFMELSAITTRLAEIRLTCVRSESRRLTALRTREIDPLMDQCDRLFRLHSRVQSARQMEWDQTRNLT